jgi:hypothetical protein
MKMGDIQHREVKPMKITAQFFPMAARTIYRARTALSVLMAVVFLLFLFATPDVARATHSPGTLNPGHDFAVGGGRHLAFGTGPDFVTEGFAAQSGPLGENPRGHVSANSPGVEGSKTQGHVICLNVVGNEAFILWEQEKAGESVPKGTLILLHVIDNGPPKEGVSPDFIRNSFIPFIEFPPTPGAGPCGTPVLPPVPLEEGNITVHDGLPPSLTGVGLGDLGL